MLKVLSYQGFVILLYAVAWFFFALYKKRNDVADIAWGGGFVFAALTAFMVQGVQGSRSILVLNLVILWGMRLMLHIGWRNRGKPFPGFSLTGLFVADYFSSLHLDHLTTLSSSHFSRYSWTCNLDFWIFL